MSGKKGMKKYPLGIRETVVSRIHSGESQRSLNKEYGISRYAIQSWLKEPDMPKKRGRKPEKHWRSTRICGKEVKPKVKYAVIHRYQEEYPILVM